MGKRGPRPTPTKILSARGSWRAKERAGEVEFDKVRPRQPAWLKGNARYAWDRLAPVLFDKGLLTPPDRDALAVYCSAYADYLAAQAEVRRLGMVISAARGGKKINPAVRIADKAAALMDTFGAKFGLSPADRVGLKTTEGPKARPTGKERFFRK